MVNKVSVSKWPVVPGDYVIGSRYSPVAVMVVCSSDKKSEFDETLVETAKRAGAAIAGICRTANIGLEYVVANLVSNPNIRWLIVTGAQDNAHKCGLAMIALWYWGVDSSTRAILCRADKPCSPELVPEAYLPNISLRAIERFRKQVNVIPALPAFDEPPRNVKLIDIQVGTKRFTVPVLEEAWKQGELVLVVVKQYLPQIVEFLVHSCLQEPENAVKINEIWHQYMLMFPARDYILYDPGAYPEEPIIEKPIPMQKREEKEQSISVSVSSSVPMFQTLVELYREVENYAKLAVKSLGVSDELVPIVGFTPVFLPKKLIERPNLPLNSIIDLDWIVIGRFRRFRDGYEALKNHIIEKGIDRPTRHGDTKEVCAILVYEELPKFRFRRIGRCVTIEDYDFSDVAESTYPIKSWHYFKQYCEDLLNGEWRGDYAYSYGAQLRKYNYDIYRHRQKTIRVAGYRDVKSLVYEEMLREFFDEGGILVVDQLEALVNNIEKMPLERCHVVTFWNPVLDTTGLRSQPCFISLQVIIREKNRNEWILESFCHMRSHDFLNAHIENAYGLASIINYIVWRLKERNPTKFNKLKIGRLTWAIVSCHIYKKHIGLE